MADSGPTSSSAALASELQQQAAQAALSAECLDDALPELATTVKRKHVHYTHVRTTDPNNAQPDIMTRKQVWAHMEKVYKEAYPVQSGSSTGSILSFGAVAKERHRQSAKDQNRAEHHHIIVFCTQQHYWNKVAKISREKYKLPLNAVAHDGYTQMYEYLKVQTPKKPLSELDAEMELSALHPRGEDLSRILEAGRSSLAGLRARKKRGTQDDDGNETAKRQRLPSIFEVVKNNEIRTLVEFQQFANREALEGRTALAEYFTRNGSKVETMIQNAWAVLKSEGSAEPSRLEKLKHAAENCLCCCNGRWKPGIVKILTANGHQTQEFARAVFTALRVGAKRGVNVACVGKGGCGKSTLLESLELVFESVSAKPERGSSFPLEGAIGADILLWQDYTHDEATVSWTDLLSFVVGESVNVRLPAASNVKVRNRAPMFYSARGPMKFTCRDLDEMREKNDMMEDRFRIFHFSVPLPKEDKDPEFPKCPKCCAEFYLAGGRDIEIPSGDQAQSSASSSSAPLAGASEGSRPPALERLLEITNLYKEGHLTAEEFAAAKQLLLRI